MAQNERTLPELMQRRKHTDDIIGGNQAHLNTVASAAGSAGVIQGGGVSSQQLWLQSGCATPILGMNPGVSAPSIGDRPSANPVFPYEQLGLHSASQGTFPNRVPTAGISMVPVPQGPSSSSVMPNGMQPPQLTEKKQTIQSRPILPLTQAQLAHAEDMIQNLKYAYSAKLPTMQLHELSDGRRTEYSRLLQQLHEMTQDLDVRLPLYWIVLRSDNMIRNLVAIISLVAYQMASYLTVSNLVIIDPSALKSMRSLLHSVIEHFRHQTMEAAVAP
ncbi:uncharacterized protein EDB91DRAFT_178628 [Suillus paluster]|uniref:uncharacterized protein n=1 Tax=Suillus paluster TaxID=48578 RepID=UPI001B860470|nr:uncharacterized protein EDB91DRAFT_178628 [Suillus paluster]KAG1723352.1 hypothetical protein EDB91DRAFT_178628 [Suillus paluster]